MLSIFFCIHQHRLKSEIITVSERGEDEDKMKFCSWIIHAIAYHISKEFPTKRKKNSNELHWVMVLNFLALHNIYLKRQQCYFESILKPTERNSKSNQERLFWSSESSENMTCFYLSQRQLKEKGEKSSVENPQVSSSSLPSNTETCKQIQMDVKGCAKHSA